MDWSLFDWVQIVDLTHALAPGIPQLASDAPLQVEPRESEHEGGKWASLSLALSDHTGTHLDAPRHLDGQGPGVDRILARDLILPGSMVDVREQVQADPEYRIGKRDIEDWETRNGWIAPGSVVLFQTGWSFRWGEPERYMHHDEAGTLSTPGLGGEAAQFLVEERKVRAVGIDGPSIDVGRSGTYPAHRSLLGGGCFVLENLTQLHALPEADFMLLTAPLKLKDGTGAPVRVLALLPRS